MSQSESLPPINPGKAHIDAEHPRTEESQGAYITPEAPPSAQTIRALESDISNNAALFNSDFTAEYEEFISRKKALKAKGKLADQNAQGNQSGSNSDAAKG